MNGKFFWLLITVIFILVGHLVYVLFFPGYKMTGKLQADLFSQSTPAFIVLNEKQMIELFPAEDPSVLHAVCPFDVTQGSVRISIAPAERYWSLSIYSQKGDSYYAINDSQTIDSKLDIHIQQAVQKENALEENQRKLVPDQTVIEAPTEKGWAVLRFRVLNQITRSVIAEQAKLFTCKRGD